MAALTSEQQKLTWDLCRRRITVEQFVAAAGIDPRQPGFAERSLAKAIAGREGRDFEAVLLLIGQFRLHVPNRAQIFAALLAERWHQKHEDLAIALQLMRDPGTVEALARAARSKFEYFYDESHAFARKCCWALADIGTRAARDRLRELAECEDAEIRGYAQKRLDRWATEMPRKGPNADPP